MAKRLVLGTDGKVREIGATGKHPRGKIRSDDEGEVNIAISVDRVSKTVILDFGTPVVWMGFSKEVALQLAKGIIEKANEL